MEVKVCVDVDISDLQNSMNKITVSQTENLLDLESQESMIVENVKVRVSRLIANVTAQEKIDFLEHNFEQAAITIDVMNKASSKAVESSSLILAGIGLAAVGYAGRYLLRTAPQMSQKMAEALKALPKVDGSTFASSKYYKGGFEQKMSRREASLVLGVSPTASKIKVKEAHKRIMLVNHPDRGGSPYIAAKINEAKDLLEKGK